MAKDKKKRQCKFFLEGEFVYYRREDINVLPQEIYNVLRSASNKQKKENERDSRCLVKGKKKKAKRCMENCDNCLNVKGYSYNPDEPRPGQRTGGIISIDLMEELGKPIPATMSIEALFEYKELHEALHIAIRTLEAVDQRITTLLLDGLSERAIAEVISAKQSFVHYHKTQIIIPALREKLKDFR